MPREIFEAVQASRRAELRSALAPVLSAVGTPLILEIGCGHGHFLTAYASVHPEQQCIGISNLHFLRCDARNFLMELPAGMTLTDIYILFPDPWPKKRHHKNRLLQTAFLNELGARAGQGSRFFFRTDYQPYFDEAREIIADHPQWRLLSDSSFPFEHVTIFQSRAAVYYSLGAVFRQPDL
jgi:tRNA (guanine-N7-)-methyltransferase